MNINYGNNNIIIKSPPELLWVPHSFPFINAGGFLIVNNTL